MNIFAGFSKDGIHWDIVIPLNSKQEIPILESFPVHLDRRLLHMNEDRGVGGLISKSFSNVKTHSDFLIATSFPQKINGMAFGDTLQPRHEIWGEHRQIPVIEKLLALSSKRTHYNLIFSKVLLYRNPILAMPYEMHRCAALHDEDRVAVYEIVECTYISKSSNLPKELNNLIL